MELEWILGGAGVLSGLAWWLLSQSSAESAEEPVEEGVAAPTSTPQEQEAQDHSPPPAAEQSWGGRLFAGLARTRGVFAGLFASDQLDEAWFEALEIALLRADVGVATTRTLLASLKETARTEEIDAPEALRHLLKAQMLSLLEGAAAAPKQSESPHVIMVVGVNGSGKTTTLGKLAARHGREGKKVLLGAGDTFRAGAIEQLQVWAERAKADCVAHQEGADPAAVIFDALKAGKARGCDLILCDTAGRLQSQRPLMDQLTKIHRVMDKGCPGAPHEVLLVLDATIGQNALAQAKNFTEAAKVTGVVLTKLDGTAKGGVVLAVTAELGLPVQWIGVGEAVEDLRPFAAREFVEALLAGPEP